MVSMGGGLLEGYGGVIEVCLLCIFFFFQAEDGIRDGTVTGVQTCVFRSEGMDRSVGTDRGPARDGVPAGGRGVRHRVERVSVRADLGSTHPTGLGLQRAIALDDLREDRKSVV